MALTAAQAALGAAGIQTAGSLIGGMLGDSGDNVGKHEYKEAAYGTIKGKVRAAKEFGLHPLFALGTATPGPMQAIPGQSNWGSVAKEAAAHTAGALRDLVPQRTQAETDLLAAQTENWQLRNEALRKANTDPAPHGAGAVSSPAGDRFKMIPAEVTHPDPQKPHREAGPAAPLTKKYVTGYDLDGNPVTADLSQATAEELGWLFDAHRVFNSAIGHRRQREMRRYLDKFDQIMRKLTGRKSPIAPTPFKGKSGYIRR